MQTSTLFEAIASLSPWEIQSLRKWLHSPAFCNRAEPSRLLEYLHDCLRKSKSPQTEDAEKILFGKTGTGNKLRHEMSELLRIVREFLIYQEMQNDLCRSELYWVKVTRKRGLEKNLQIAFREAEKSIEQIGKANIVRYLLDFQFTMEKYDWELKAQRAQILPFEALTTALNNWYAGQLVQLSTMDETQSSLRKQARTEPEWIAQLLEILPGKPHETEVGIALYHLGMQMLTQVDAKDLPAQFRQQLAENLPDLPHDEAKGLLMLAINHGIRRINAGQREAIRSVQEFYLLGLEKQVLQDERGILSKYTYNNVLMTFVALQDWDAALVFLEKYREQLPKDEQENIYAYNLAIFRFRKGDYAEALTLLRDVTFPDAMYNLESRKMLLKIYYEQGDFDPLESLLDNLQTWLRRHGELGYHREMYRNLARFMARLLRLPPGDKEGRQKLAKKIRDTPLVAERAWLLEKV